MSKLRVTFAKGEALRYTGHLDILRTFVRGLRRACIPVKYSEGFNPHAVMTFILPMGVGVTSECEIVDITLREQIPVDDFISKVNQNMQPNGIKVLSAKYTASPMPVICKATYNITVISETEISKDEITVALEKSEILTEKKSKKQIKTVNIIEHIFKKDIALCEGNMLQLQLIVSAGNTFNIKPDLAIHGIASVADSLNPVSILPHRVSFVFD